MKELNVLNEREKMVLSLILQGYTLKEVGNNLGITPERVRQIEYKAYVRLTVPVGRDYKVHTLARAINRSYTAQIEDIGKRVIALEDLAEDNKHYWSLAEHESARL